MNKQFLMYTKSAVFAVALVVGLSAMQANWTPPPAGVTPPGDNPSVPLNVGTATQIKDGNLGANGTISSAHADFVTDVKSPQYCIGASCITAWSQAGGAADNLGSHVATKDLSMSNFDIGGVKNLVANMIYDRDNVAFYMNPQNHSNVTSLGAAQIFSTSYCAGVFPDVSKCTANFNFAPTPLSSCGVGSSLHWSGGAWSCDVNVTPARFGVGQTWQSMVGVQSGGAIQLNSTDKPIMVFARAKSTATGNASVTINIDPNGVNLMIGYGAPLSGSLVSAAASAVIPVGAYYTVNFSGTGTAMDKWMELK